MRTERISRQVHPNLRRIRWLALLILATIAMALGAPQLEAQEDSVQLVAVLSPEAAYAGDRSLTLTLRVQDAHGQLKADYLGKVRLQVTVAGSTTTGLPTTYQFTAADAGRHAFSDWGFNGPGTQAIEVYDIAVTTRRATSNGVAVANVILSAEMTPGAAYGSDRSLTLTIEARDAEGALAPGYRGSLDINPTGPVTGLPQSVLNGAADYAFTAADAGRHVFTAWGFNTDGFQTITVTDRAWAARSTTTNSVVVRPVWLVAAVSPTLASAGERILSLAVEAIDENGTLVPGFRGALDLNPSCVTQGLPQSVLQGSPDYTFSEQDAGRHVFSGFAFSELGQQTITIIDRKYTARRTTTPPVDVANVSLVLKVTPDHAIARDSNMALTVEAVDDAGQPVCGYRGEIDFSSPGSVIGVPTNMGATADYVFTAEDCGQHTFQSVGFLEPGTFTIAAHDRKSALLTGSSNSVTVSLPPDPEPPGRGAVKPTDFAVPSQLDEPPPFEFTWGPPFKVKDYNVGLNFWKGYPAEAVLAGAGAFYVVRGVSERDPGSWWASTFYICPYLWFEHTLTSERQTGDALGQHPYSDPTGIEDGLFELGCGPASSYYNDGARVSFGPALAGPSPIGTQGVHINVQAAGNTTGAFSLGANTANDEIECGGYWEVFRAGDPVETRGGSYYNTRIDLGVRVGCSDVALSFERTYHTLYGAAGALGPGWVHNFEERLILQGDSALVQLPRGSIVAFRDVGFTAQGYGVYAGVPGSRYVLIRRPGDQGYALIHRSRRVDLFDTAGRMIAQQDPNGNMLWMTYEPYGRGSLSGERLVRVDAEGGRYLWFGYDYYTPNRLTVVGDHAGRRSRYTYDAGGQLKVYTDPEGASSTYAYQADWLLSSEVDARGVILYANTYDDMGRVIHQGNAAGQELAFNYEVLPDDEHLMTLDELGEKYRPFIFKTTVQDQTGLTAIFEYGSDGLIRRRTDPDAAVTRYSGYTTTRRPTLVEYPEGRRAVVSYDANGLPVTLGEGDGQEVVVAYDLWGRPLQVRTRTNQTLTYTYSGPNLVVEQSSAGPYRRYVYRDVGGHRGLLAEIHDNGALSASFEYNGAGDLTSVTDAIGRRVQIATDALGRETTVTAPNGTQTLFEYDARSDVVRATVRGGIEQRTTSFNYDSAGQLVSTTDPLGHETRYTYDNAGRVASEVLANDATTGFQYDLRGNLTGLIPPGRSAHQFTYIPSDFLVSSQRPEEQATLYEHDLAGQLRHVRRPDGAGQTFTYDTSGRLRFVASTRDNVEYTYGAATRRLERTSSSANGTLLFGYDTKNALLAETWSGLITGVVEQPSNDFWQVASQVVNSGPAVVFEYDAARELVRAGELTLSRSPTTGLLTTTDLEVVRDEYSYDIFGELSSYTVSSNGQALLSFSYQRDANGRVTRVIESSATDLRSTDYQYDRIGQLVSVARNGVETARFTYDMNGNRTEKRTPAGVETGTVDGADRLTSYGNREYTYAPNGELETVRTAVGFTSFAYHDFGALLSATLSSGTRVDYILDPEGRRVGKRVNGSLVQGFLYADALRPIAELDANGSLQSEFVYATLPNTPDYMIRGGRNYRIISDHLGSPRIVVDAETGAIAQRLDYDEFGKLVEDTAPGFQPFGFAGGLLDRDTGLVHFGLREYDPESGRWTSPDPIGFAGGDTNLYGYVVNDPTNLIDPQGTNPLGLLADIGMSALGYQMAGLCYTPLALLSDVLSYGIAKYLSKLDDATDARRGFGYADDTPNPGRCRGGTCSQGCFVAGTPVDTDSGLVPIETLNVGDRVIATDPACAHDHFDATWRVVKFRLVDAEGGPVDVELARPLAWLTENGFVNGGRPWVEFSELNLAGSAEIESIEPAPADAPGDGCLVLMTIARVSPAILELGIEGSARVLELTPSHRLFAEDQGWVSASELILGNALRTESGTATVAHVAPSRPDQRVYNLEVARDHAYFVHEARIWAHNEYPKGGVDLTEKGRRILGNLAALKDVDAAEAIRRRGGNGANVRKALGNSLLGKTVGELANMAAGGDKAAASAIKIIKQAAAKGQKY